MEEDLSGLREEPAVYQDGLPEVLPEGKEEERLAEREAQEDAALMENPATWDLTEEIIAEAIRKNQEETDAFGRIGWSLAKDIAEALRTAGLLNEGP